jgi:phage terminase small subunit
VKGRKPLPTRLKVLAGNPGRQRLPKGEPVPEPGVCEPPEWLCPYAAEVWRRDATWLVNMGVLGQSHWAIFAAYCQAVADVRRAREALAAGLVQVKDDLLDGLERVGGSAEARELLEAIPGEVLNKGGSLIAAPDTRMIAQAGEGEETLLAELDLGEVGAGLTNLDTDGHYARPDVFELTVDSRAKDGVNWR